MTSRISRRSLLLSSISCGICALSGYGIGRRTHTSRPATPTNDDVVPRGEITKNNAQRIEAQPDGLFRLPTKEPLVALTFDDGPDPAYTGTVLKLLGSAGAAATFFHVGVNARGERDLVKRILDAGHTIGNHTFDHRELELLPPDRIQLEIERGGQAIIASGAPQPRLFRPPKGYTDEAVGVLADAEKYRTVFWDLCVERFVNHQPVANGVDQILAKLRPGSIVLAHDGGRIAGSGRPPLSRARTMEALPILLRGIDKRGLEIVDVPTLLRRTDTPLLPTTKLGQ